MMRIISALLLSCLLGGCVNVYHHIDHAPDGSEMHFRGMADYLEGGRSLYVIQVHGMGDHSFGNDCAPGSENLALQGEIATRLGYVNDPSYATQGEHPIPIDSTEKAGTYSVTHFLDPVGNGGDLYFSCVTWGETSSEIKRRMLQLDDNFLEQSQNESHRALINRWAKRFVNRSFSDPVLYLGPMGGYIRRVIWKGLGLSVREHARLASVARGAGSAETAAPNIRAFLTRKSVAIISDSLGSRIVFDSLCSEGGESCGSPAGAAIAESAHTQRMTLERVGEVDQLLVNSIEGSVGSVYMLANQLPLLELGFLQLPPQDAALGDFLASTTDCYMPFPQAWANSSNSRDGSWGGVQVIAFTDPNDALSYNLSNEFKRRCGFEGARNGADSGSIGVPIELINVTLPNTRPRWLFVYSDLIQAHSSGFKKNSRAIDYLVHGNH